MSTIQFDHASILQRLLENFSKTESAEGVLPTAVTTGIFSVVAEELAELGKQREYLARENKWDLAKNYSSLLYQGKFRGYDALRKIGATGKLKISPSPTFDSSHPYDIIIKKYDTFSTRSGIEFCATISDTFLQGTDTKEIPVVQGTPRSQSFEALGNINERFQVLNANIEQYTFDVIVNGETWTRVEYLEDYSEDDKVYELYNIGKFEGIEILFGNNLAGRRLNAFDRVVFKYVETLGANSNLMILNNLTKVDSEFYDTQGTIVQLYCTNEDFMQGGKNVDTLNDIRRKGVDSFKAGNKAVDYTGYRYNLAQHPYIEKAIVWGAYEYNLDRGRTVWDFIPSNDNVVYVSALTPDGNQLTAAQKTEIIQDFVSEGIKPPADIMRFEDVGLIGLEFTIHAFVQDSSVALNTLISNIKQHLLENYNINNFDFKENLYHTVWQGDITGMSRSRVAHHTSSITFVAYTKFNNPSFSANINLALFPIASGVRVYIKDTSLPTDEQLWVQIAYSNGGGWVGEGGYSVDGVMILQSGEGNLTVTGLTSEYSDYEIKVLYVQESSLDVILRQRNQILKLDDTMYVTAEYELIN